MEERKKAAIDSLSLDWNSPLSWTEEAPNAITSITLLTHLISDLTRQDAASQSFRRFLPQQKLLFDGSNPNGIGILSAGQSL